MGDVAKIFTTKITDLINQAKKFGDITTQEADLLLDMAEDSPAALSTQTLLSKNEAPNFNYAALHFASKVWRTGDSAEDDVIARAGYMLAQFVMTQELHESDPYWAAKLLREIYNAHE